MAKVNLWGISKIGLIFRKVSERYNVVEGIYNDIIFYDTIYPDNTFDFTREIVTYTCVHNSGSFVSIIVKQGDGVNADKYRPTNKLLKSMDLQVGNLLKRLGIRYTHSDKYNAGCAYDGWDHKLRLTVMIKNLKTDMHIDLRKTAYDPNSGEIYLRIKDASRYWFSPARLEGPALVNYKGAWRHNDKSKTDACSYISASQLLKTLEHPSVIKHIRKWG